VQVREQYATAISKLDQLALAGKEPVTNSAGQTILFTVLPYSASPWQPRRRINSYVVFKFLTNI
jgi:hypothetical protein